MNFTENQYKQIAISTTLKYNVNSLYTGYTVNKDNNTVTLIPDPNSFGEEYKKPDDDDMDYKSLDKEALRSILFQKIFRLFVANSTYGIVYNSNKYEVRYEDVSSTPKTLKYIVGEDKFEIPNSKYVVKFVGTYRVDDDLTSTFHLINLDSLATFWKDRASHIKDDNNLDLLYRDLSSGKLSFGLPEDMEWGVQTLLYHPFFESYYKGETSSESGEGLKANKWWGNIDAANKKDNLDKLNDVEKEIAAAFRETFKSQIKGDVEDMLKYIYNNPNDNPAFSTANKTILKDYHKKMKSIYQKLLTYAEKTSNLTYNDLMILEKSGRAGTGKNLTEYFFSFGGTYYPKALEYILYLLLKLLIYVDDVENKTKNEEDLKKELKIIEDGVDNDLNLNYSTITTSYEKDIKKLAEDYAGIILGKTFEDIYNAIPDPTNINPTKENMINAFKLEKEAEALGLTEDQKKQLKTRMDSLIENYINNTVKVTNLSVNTKQEVENADKIITEIESLNDKIKTNQTVKDKRTEIDNAKTLIAIQKPFYDKMVSLEATLKTNADKYKDDASRDAEKFPSLEALNTTFNLFETAKTEYKDVVGKKYFNEEVNSLEDKLNQYFNPLKTYIEARRVWYNKYTTWSTKIDSFDFNKFENENDLEAEYQSYNIEAIKVNYGDNDEYKETYEGKALQTLLNKKQKAYETRLAELTKDPIEKKVEQLSDNNKKYFSVNTYKTVTDADRKEKFEAALDIVTKKEEVDNRAIANLFFADM